MAVTSVPFNFTPIRPIGSLKWLREMHKPEPQVGCKDWQIQNVKCPKRKKDGRRGNPVTKRKPEKIQGCTGFKSLTSAIPVQHSNQ